MSGFALVKLHFLSVLSKCGTHNPTKETERSIAMQKKLRRDVSTEQKNKDETNCLTGFPLIAFQGTQKGYSLDADFK